MDKPTSNGNGNGKVVWYLLQAASAMVIAIFGVWAHSIDSELDTLRRHMEDKLAVLTAQQQTVAPQISSLRAKVDAKLESIDQRLDAIDRKLDALIGPRRR